MYQQTLDGKFMTYWDLPELQIPNNSRVASVSIHFAIIEKYQICAGISGEPTKPLYALIRHPVERYRSALSKGVDNLQLGNHFQPQINALKGYKFKAYRFPEHLKQFAEDTELRILWINKSESKPDLTSDETQRIINLFSDDMKLYSSIKEAGEIFNGPFI